MWQCWQAETFGLRAAAESGQSAVVTLLTAEKIDKNTVVKELQTRLQKTEAELEKMKEKSEKDMEDPKPILSSRIAHKTSDPGGGWPFDVLARARESSYKTPSTVLGVLALGFRVSTLQQSS